MNAQRLIDLAANPSSVSLGKLWAVLSREERADAIRAALDEKDPPWLRSFLGQMVVEKLGGFRLTTVLSWDNGKLAATAAKQQIDRPAILRSSLIPPSSHRALPICWGCVSNCVSCSRPDQAWETAPTSARSRPPYASQLRPAADTAEACWCPARLRHVFQRTGFSAVWPTPF
jgi:hypothetical protein